MVKRPHTLRLNETDRALLAGEIASHGNQVVSDAASENERARAQLDAWLHLVHRIDMLRVHRLRQKTVHDDESLHEHLPYKLRLSAVELALLSAYMSARLHELQEFVHQHAHQESIQALIGEKRRHLASIEKVHERLCRMRRRALTSVAA